MIPTNENINQFIINTVLINPIEDIILKLNNNEFRDCDIKWLDLKFEKFIKFAGETLGVTGFVNSDCFGANSFKYLTDYSKAIYIKRFQTLLDYFKTF